MDQSKTYSHFRSFSRSKSKQKSPNKSLDKTISREKSVTFSSDVDLIKSISCQENLLNLIGRVQKQRQEYIQSLQSSQSTALPPLQIELEQNRNSRQKPKKLITHDTIDFVIPIDPYKKQLYQKQNIYGKFIEPTQYKKIDYQSIKTFESAISLQAMHELNKQTKSKVYDSEIINIQQSSQLKQQQLDEEIKKFDQLLQQNYHQDCDLYQEQSKINKIIDEALKIKQLKRDPTNASKSLKQQKAQMRQYLQNQYKNALSSAMQGINSNQSDDDIFLRKKHSKKSKKAHSNSNIASQYTTKAIRSQSIHPERKQYLNKALDIYDKCYAYLN